MSLLQMLLFGFMPEPARVEVFVKTTRGMGRLYYRNNFLKLLAGYEEWYDERRAKVIAWHREQLERLEPAEKVSSVWVRYTIACDNTDAVGMSPFNPKYPNLRDQFLKKPGSKDEHRPGTISD